jgi:hypothetical protein
MSAFPKREKGGMLPAVSPRGETPIRNRLPLDWMAIIMNPCFKSASEGAEVPG